MEEIVIVLPIPDRRLNPNTPGDWRSKIAVRAKAKNDAFVKAKEVLERRKPPQWLSAHIEIRAWYRDKRKHDTDNTHAACKSYLDGIVRAGILKDDNHIDVFIPEGGYDKANPRVEFRIRPKPSIAVE